MVAGFIVQVAHPKGCTPYACCIEGQGYSAGDSCRRECRDSPRRAFVGSGDEIEGTVWRTAPEFLVHEPPPRLPMFRRIALVDGLAPRVSPFGPSGKCESGGPLAMSAKFEPKSPSSKETSDSEMKKMSYYSTCTCQSRTQDPPRYLHSVRVV